VTRLTTEDGVVGEIYNGEESDHLEAIVNMIKKDSPANNRRKYFCYKWHLE
jgi:hypothetical protein